MCQALPNTRLESKTDSMAYNRASVHLLTFKRALVEGARVLSEALQWVSLVDYAVMAWGYVKVRTEPVFIKQICSKKLILKLIRFQDYIFTDVLFCRLHDIYENRSFCNNTGSVKMSNEEVLSDSLKESIFF